MTTEEKAKGMSYRTLVDALMAFGLIAVGIGADSATGAYRPGAIIAVCAGVLAVVVIAVGIRE